MSGILLASAYTTSSVANYPSSATTFLLNGIGNNGDTANTDLHEDGPFNLSMTAFGNTAVQNFSPFSSEPGKWSYNANAIKGQAGFVRIENNAALNGITGDYTFECWAMRMQIGSFDCLYSLATSGAVVMRINSNTSVGSALLNTTYDTTIFQTEMPVGKWAHIAFTRQSGLVRFFLNGNLVTSATNTASVSFSGGATAVGTYNASGNQEWVGYISNMRIITGTALYTSNFTPPTEPLTVISGTQLLTFNGPALYDQAGVCQMFATNNNDAVTETAGTSTLNPFGEAENTATYGSIYGDGTGDYMTAAAQSGNAFGTGDFTIECWFYPTTGNASFNIFGAAGTANSNSAWVLCRGATSTTALRLLLVNTGSSTVPIESPANAIDTHSWNHLVACRSAGTLRLYANGFKIHEVANTTNVTVTSSPTGFLANSAGQNVSSGFITGCKVVSGTALYTGNTYTLPTAPPATSTGTILLANFDTPKIYSSVPNTGLISPSGNISISTDQSVYGGSSLRFDGTTGLYAYNASGVEGWHNGDFTLETWVNIGLTNGTAFYLWDARTSATANWHLMRSTGNLLDFRVTNGTTKLLGTTQLLQNTWYHVACTRASGTLRLFVNGNLESSVSSTETMSNFDRFSVGTAYDNSFRLTGYIQGFRTILGYAAYTTNFTPPTSY